MTTALIVVIVVLVVALVALAVVHFGGRRQRGAANQGPRTERILFPYMADALSKLALEAALRIAQAEDATLVPVFLARVPLNLPLDAPLPRQSGVCLPLQEAIEQRATEAGVPVESRVERGRSYRHALRQAIAHERFDWLVAAAAGEGSPGFDADEIAWLLDHAPGEIVIMRPGQDTRPATARRGRRRPRRARRPPALSRGYETAASR